MLRIKKILTQAASIFFLLSNGCSKSDASAGQPSPQYRNSKVNPHPEIQLNENEKNQVASTSQKTIRNIFYDENENIDKKLVFTDLNYTQDLTGGNPNYHIDQAIESLKNVVKEGKVINFVKDGARRIAHYSKESTQYQGYQHLLLSLDDNNNVLGYLDFWTSGIKLEKRIYDSTNDKEGKIVNDLNLNSTDTIYLSILVVKNEQRKSGIAQNLLNYLEQYAKKIGKKNLLLYTWNKGLPAAGETEAHKFYRKAGFTHKQERKDKTVYMVKSL